MSQRNSELHKLAVQVATPVGGGPVRDGGVSKRRALAYAKRMIYNISNMHKQVSLRRVPDNIQWSACEVFAGCCRALRGPMFWNRRGFVQSR